MGWVGMLFQPGLRLLARCESGDYHLGSFGLEILAVVLELILLAGRINEAERIGCGEKQLLLLRGLGFFVNQTEEV
ncbi:Hypothetical protein AA314_01560 [Archangium gephyra]|uniref:Uncharacterized protein n=1 Tax=Archangium gephyra TaxID=48 RepID=A0AAC8Q3P4_9BACT|nr:Hypothetical protein AA314_01560 [Archangium gephyra]